MRIAFPTSALAAPLVHNIHAVCEARGWQAIPVDERRAGELLLKGMADAALVSPLGYGIGVSKVDYRIVTGPCVQLHDFTNIVGMNFKPHITEIRTFGSSTPNDFLVTAAGIVLGEKFETKLEQAPPEAADFTIDYTVPGTTSALDVGEEWFDLVELPLPALLWTCRIDADIDALPDAVLEMADTSIAEAAVSEMVPPEGDHFPREGRITYRWSDDTEEALESILHMLYYHQYLPDIPAIKLLGRD